MSPRRSRLSDRDTHDRGDARSVGEITAIFLGAGASAPFGFPLTRDILPRIRKEIASGELFEGFWNAKAAAKQLDEYLEALLPGYARPDIELPSITEVLSLVDYSLLVSTSPMRGTGSRDLVHFRQLLEQAIYDVLWWPYGPGEVPELLRRFTDRIWKIIHNPYRRLGIISTNYDIAVESEIAERYPGEMREECLDYGFHWRDVVTGALHARPANPDLHCFKLHGSVNWLRCELCEHVYINMWGPIGDWAWVDKRHEHNTCHCDHSPLRPVLVAPSLVRDVRDVNLLETWKHALEFLRTADEWVIIGYSFPPEDIAVRSLFIRAWQGRGRPPRVRVIQKGHDAATESRYRVLFPDCDYSTAGLEAAIDTL